MRAPSTPATTARRSRPQRGGNEPGRSCRAVALVRIPQREYQPRRCRRHQRSHGVVGNCHHTKRRTRQEPRRARPHDRRTAPLRSRRRRTPSRCHGGTAKRPRSRVNRPRGRELSTVPRARAGAGRLVERRARVVEMGGIEPPSDGGATGLLRVQSAHEFLSPGISRGQGHRRAQLPACSKAPDSEGPQQWLPG